MKMDTNQFTKGRRTFPLVTKSNMMTAIERLKTFDTWPKQMTRPSKEQLALAGFVYTGKGDLVYCFACGKQIKDWLIDDIPFAEHYRWSRDCEYLQLTYVPQNLSSVTYFSAWNK